MVIQHNLPAMNSHRNMGLNNAGTSKNLEKLSSGFKINRAGDDAAGLAISEKMRGQIRGLAMAEQNTANGVSLIQTAEGGLNETHAILQRMRELAVQASNGTYQEEDRLQITNEYEALKSEVDRISQSTHYNGIKLLDGSLGRAVTGVNTTGATSTAGLHAFVTAIAGSASSTVTAAGVPTTATPTAAETFTAEVTFSLDQNGQFMLSVAGTASGTNLNTGTAYSASYVDGVVTITASGTNAAATTSATTSISYAFNEERMRQVLESSADGKYTFTGEAAAAANPVAAANAAAPTRYTTTGSNSAVQTSLGLAITASANASERFYGDRDVSIEKFRDASGNVVNGKYVLTVGQESMLVTDADLVSTGAGVNIGGLNIVQAGAAASGTLSGKQVFDAQMKKGDMYVDGVRMADTGGTGVANNHLVIDFGKSTVRTGDGVVFQIGANGGQDQRVSLKVDNMDSSHIGMKKGDVWEKTGEVLTKDFTLNMTNINEDDDANKAIEVISAATNMVSAQRAKLGALQNRLEHTLNNLGVTKENLTAAESSIRDVDMAKEMMEFTKNNILVQASQAMLAQANQLPQGVLQLLR